MFVVWNALTEDVYESNMLGQFKSKLLSKIRLDKKSVCDVRNIHGIRCLGNDYV